MEGLKAIVFVLVVVWLLGAAFLQYILDIIEKPDYVRSIELTKKQIEQAGIGVIFWPFFIIILILLYPFVLLSRKKN